jgi:hypothetical protein
MLARSATPASDVLDGPEIRSREEHDDNEHEGGVIDENVEEHIALDEIKTNLGEKPKQRKELKEECSDTSVRMASSCEIET